jgi:hypothetical protein
MDQIERARQVLAERANEAAEGARCCAPRLSAHSSLETVVEWLQWNDPNGSHTPELAMAEDIEPYDLDAAWEALEDMLSYL